MSKLVAIASKTKHPKCPRCYRHTQEGHSNFDHLCDRCCGVLVSEFPDHASVPHILASRKAEREMTPLEQRLRNHAIDPDAWPLQPGDAL